MILYCHNDFSPWPELFVLTDGSKTYWKRLLECLKTFTGKRIGIGKQMYKEGCGSLSRLGHSDMNPLLTGALLWLGIKIFCTAILGHFYCRKI